ncbi:hypothetical protein [Petroclostridium xylanilyticum]|jgi:hypothetical protein|uniref:hypothetical protein n=1 Tax=Petroclostridium xylanilyticum TaxID=1792311 RepID=UPI000B991019|nr:hypothetical protein [Petroclostridium xylanilyticum]
MEHENAKQVVIIRDIKSNIIEEAIFILKSNDSYARGKKKETGYKYDPKNSDYIVKEAQSIIDNYIQQYSSGYGYITSTPKVNKLKKWNISVGTILNIALVLSIALFIFLLSRAF